ncbi:MAG: WD40 repeat domain-containing protein, partial [Okeania sp. SIO1H6]|nr:WD40 repeat domain-containing protein [Okeania sp. SIO1H6]
KKGYCILAANSPLPVAEYCWEYLDSQNKSKNYKIIPGYQFEAYVATLSPSIDSITLLENSKEAYSIIASSKLLGTHDTEVYSLALSPDSKILVSGSVDGEIKLWDVSTGKQKSSWKKHNGVVRTMAFSPDGKILASSSRDGTIKFWDAKKLETQARYLGEVNHQGGADSIAFLPKSCSQSQILASAGESGIIELWDAETRQRIKILPGHSEETGPFSRVWSVAFSPDCETLASGGHNSKLQLWDWQTEKLKNVLEMYRPVSQGSKEPRPISEVVFSPDSKTLVSSGFHSEYVHIFEVQGVSNQNPVRIMKHYCRHNSDNDSDKCKLNASCLKRTDTAQKNCGVHTIAISKNGKLLASGGYDSNIKIWNLDSKEQVGKDIPSKQGSIRKLIFSYDGNFLVSSSGYTDDSLGTNNSVKIWRPF